MMPARDLPWPRAAASAICTDHVAAKATLAPNIKTWTALARIHDRGLGADHAVNLTAPSDAVPPKASRHRIHTPAARSPAMTDQAMARSVCASGG
jgi:hypothetical protein